MKALIQRLWLKYRPCGKRFYRFGTAGLSFWDDRTRLEKICDWIDDWLREWNKRVIKHERHLWHTYWEPSAKKWITSMSDIKSIERETGKIYMDFKDIEKEADFHHKEGRKKNVSMTKKYIEQSLKEIKQGRSFIKENQERIKKGEYRIGQVPTFN